MGFGGETCFFLPKFLLLLLFNQLLRRISKPLPCPRCLLRGSGASGLCRGDAAQLAAAAMAVPHEARGEPMGVITAEAKKRGEGGESCC